MLSLGEAVAWAVDAAAEKVRETFRALGKAASNGRRKARPDVRILSETLVTFALRARAQTQPQLPAEELDGRRRARAEARLSAAQARPPGAGPSVPRPPGRAG